MSYDSPFKQHRAQLEDEWWKAAQAGPRDTFVYRYYDADDALLYVGQTGNLKARHSAHKSKKAWFPLVARRDARGPMPHTLALAAELYSILSESPLHNSHGRNGHKGPGSMHWEVFMREELDRLEAEQPGYMANEMSLAFKALDSSLSFLSPTP